MFICIEIDTDDAETWSVLEQKLSKQLGMTNIIWGVSAADDTTTTACNLPSNLFYVDAKDIKFVADKAKLIIQETCKESFRLMAIIENTWAARHGNDRRAKVTPLPSDEIEDVSRVA